jgi:uracil-DNA glycosylase family 4
MLPRCGECGLFKTCKSPKMKPSGKGRLNIMVVGEAPGADEDREGVQFVGKTGRYLRDVVRKAGFDLDRDCVKTNALICRPPDNSIKDETAIDHCRPNILKAVEEHSPDVMILLGKLAIKSVIGFLWKEDVGEVGRWVGWQIPSQRFNCWICPTWHPSFLLRSEKKDVVRETMFARHVTDALNLKGKPWKEVPDYRSKVRVVYDVDEAAKVVRRLARGDRPVAFDYETNMLKPDSDRGRIVCCSVSDGKTTVAFPWYGSVVEAMKDFLRSKVPKIASNMKFEKRWSLSKLGIDVKDWDVDTMLLSHVLDNRPSINSIKFQSFVRLGQEAYDEHIRPFLQTKGGGGYAENRVTECDLGDLMLYCGMDSLLEWKVAKPQREEMDVKS